ncbi:unnamed protein product, partial [Prorocentrum cordatum]
RSPSLALLPASPPRASGEETPPLPVFPREGTSRYARLPLQPSLLQNRPDIHRLPLGKPPRRASREGDCCARGEAAGDENSKHAGTREPALRSGACERAGGEFEFVGGAPRDASAAAR